MQKMNNAGFLRKVLGTAVRYFSKKPKPMLKLIELKTPAEQAQTITRVIFDVIKEHRPPTIADNWGHVKARFKASYHFYAQSIHQCNH